MTMKEFFRGARAIARNTFKESIRDKVLYVIFAFAFVMIAFTTFLGSVSLGEDVHIVRSLGMAAVYFFGLIIAIFLGTSLVYKEVERRTLYFVLSKPLSRSAVIAGKFAGLFASVALSIIGMAAVYLGVVWFAGGGFDTAAVAAFAAELLEMAVIVALSAFFSSFARPLASALYVLLIVYIGHSLDLLVYAVRRDGVVIRTLARGAYDFFPNLEKFNLRDAAIAGGLPNALNAAIIALYALAYCAVLLYAAALLLEKREL